MRRFHNPLTVAIHWPTLHIEQAPGETLDFTEEQVPGWQPCPEILDELPYVPPVVPDVTPPSAPEEAAPRASRRGQSSEG